MKWYNYLSAFWAGAFFANAVPHFVHGISGEQFTTPFAHHPGVGLSSPFINVLWAGFNILTGYLLLKGGKLETRNQLAMSVFFAGIIGLSILLSTQIGK